MFLTVFRRPLYKPKLSRRGAQLHTWINQVPSKDDKLKFCWNCVFVSMRPWWKTVRYYFEPTLHHIEMGALRKTVCHIWPNGPLGFSSVPYMTHWVFEVPSLHTGSLACWFWAVCYINKIDISSNKHVCATMEVKHTLCKTHPWHFTSSI